MRLTTLLLTGALLIGCLAASQAQQFLVWDLDPNVNSGPVIDASLHGNGYYGHYTTTLTPYLGTLPNYRSVWICLGAWPNNVWLGLYPQEVDSLVSYLTN
jgi:hypothetical protein